MQHTQRTGPLRSERLQAPWPLGLSAPRGPHGAGQALAWNAVSWLGKQGQRRMRGEVLTASLLPVGRPPSR